MKKLTLAFAFGCLFSTAAMAQDIYQMAEFSLEDLNGTARYVGMGGAMSALGADMSVMSSNPAGIGLYRKSDVALSASYVSQEEGLKYDGKGKNHVSFDNIGFVYSMPLETGICPFLNFGFNYHKTRNFNRLVNSGITFGSNADVTSQTFQLGDMAAFWGGAQAASPLASMANNAGLISEDGESVYNSSGLYYDRAEWGSIQSYDFNIAANLNERVYLGLTVGAVNVDYNSSSIYSEDLLNADYAYDGEYYLCNRGEVSGSGFNLKLGVIARPIETSAFRIGLAISTPTYYNLTYRNNATLEAFYADGNDPDGQYVDVHGFDYNIRTPWKINLNLGHVIANSIAIGAEYEYADYSACKVNYDDSYYDGWGSHIDDIALNDEADRHLKGISTFKLGAEWMVDPAFCVRLGYNYVSSPFAKTALRSQFINSASLDYSTSTDYMNLSDINRICVGLGAKFGNFYVDAAYQYQAQKGKFYAFDTTCNGEYLQQCPAQDIKLNRSQLLFTIGYRF